MTTQRWGLVLMAVAALTIALQLWRWKRGSISTGQAIAGLIARFGFVVLGVVYAADLVRTHRAAPFVGLGIVALGIILNLVVGIVDSIRRARFPPPDADA